MATSTSTSISTRTPTAIASPNPTPTPAEVGDSVDVLIANIRWQVFEVNRRRDDELQGLLKVARGARTPVPVAPTGPPPDANYSNSVKWLIRLHSRGSGWQRPSIWSYVKALFLWAPGPVIAPEGDHWAGNATRLILVFRLDGDGRLGRMVFEPHPRDSCVARDFKVFRLRTDKVWAEMGGGTYQLGHGASRYSPSIREWKSEGSGSTSSIAVVQRTGRVSRWSSSTSRYELQTIIG
jgi:hypothetical protein